MQIEDNKLNQQLRNLSKIHHLVLSPKNNPNSENKSLYKLENEINYNESIIQKYQKNSSLNTNNSLCFDWLQSSIYLQNKANKLKK